MKKLMGIIGVGLLLSGCVSMEKYKVTLREATPLGLSWVGAATTDIPWKGEDASGNRLLASAAGALGKELKKTPAEMVMSTADITLIKALQSQRVPTVAPEVLLNSPAYRTASGPSALNLDALTVHPEGYRSIGKWDASLCQRLQEETGLKGTVNATFRLYKGLHTGMNKTGAMQVYAELRTLVRDSTGKVVFDKTYTGVSTDVIPSVMGVHDDLNMPKLAQQAVEKASEKFAKDYGSYIL